MSLPLEAEGKTYSRVEKGTKPRKKATYILLFASWVVLITSGVLGTKWYSDHLRDRIARQISADTSAQLELIHQEYRTEIDNLKNTLTADMSRLQAQVDTLAELLAFAKDSTSSQTDNSNQLYTQLIEVKQKLDELEKSLEVLK